MLEHSTAQHSSTMAVRLRCPSCQPCAPMGCRADAKQALEAFAYNLRNHLGDAEGEKLPEADRAAATAAIDEAVKWVEEVRHVAAFISCCRRVSVVVCALSFGRLFHACISISHLQGCQSGE